MALKTRVRVKLMAILFESQQTKMNIRIPNLLLNNLVASLLTLNKGHLGEISWLLS